MSTTPPSTILELPTKADAAYAELRRRIIDGQLKPGVRLDQEMIAQELGLSTTPVREALRRLEADHLVQRSAHKDVTITPLSMTEARELYAVREELDGLAIFLATKRSSREQIEVIRNALPKVGPSADPAEQLRSNRLFHRAVYRASGNAVLIEILESLWDRSDRYRVAILRDPRQATAATSEHEQIVEVMMSGDAKLAAKLMREHLSESLASIEERLFAGDDDRLG